MAFTLYRVCLLVLPGWFREEFGAEMTAVFRETMRDARSAGAGAVVALWLATLRDVACLAFRLHLDAGRQDVVYAWRTLARTPAFSLAIVATLAIGLGPTLVVANLLERVVLQPLPFAEPDRLVAMWNGDAARGRHELPLSLPDFVDFQGGQQAFQALAAHTGTSVAMVIEQEPRQVAGVLTTAELASVLRVSPALGRPLLPADSAPGAPPVIVLGDDLWRSSFGARPEVVGTMVRVDGTPTEIVGVLPPLDYPSSSRGFWLPLTIDPAAFNRGSHYLSATGRLSPAVSIEQASDALNAIARALGEQFPSTNGGNGIELIPLKQQLSGDAPRLILVLAMAIAAVLLIACSNVASLLAVRASMRHTELALRTAIGASLRRLRRQMLVEHLLLAACGGAAAIAMAVPMHAFIVRERILALPRTAAPTMGVPAIAGLGFLVIVIAVGLARLTARRHTAAASAAALLTAIRHSGGRTEIRMRQALVVVQIAAALALVAIAGLMVQSVARLARVDPGFRTQGVVTFGVVLPATAYPDATARLQFVERVVENLRALPGVAGAASAGYAPMGQMRATRRFAPADRPLPGPGDEPVALDMPVGVGYFDVMGVPLVEGRTFTARDAAAAAPVLVVSEAFAREVFPGKSAVGQRIAFYASRPGGTPPPTREIVGVVRDVRQDGVSRRPIPHMYTPFAQTSWGFTSFFLRVEGEPAALAAMLQSAVSRVDPLRPVRDVRSTAEIVRGSTARQRAMTWMLAVLAGIALLLATVGMYGVSATSAAARSRELAIRAAIGAQPAALLRLAVGQGLLAGLLGVVLGAAASLAVTQGIEAFLFETRPRDPATFLLTSAALLLVTALATWVPARRALRSNPAEVLRGD